MSEFLTYKEKPLVRKGNEIYYGDMSEKYIIKLDILSTKKQDDLTCADKIRVTLMLSDKSAPDKERIVKTSEKSGLYEAMDIGSVWLDRALKK